MTRIGLRYLNRIEIPLPVPDLKNFCLLLPDLPEDMPQGMSEFFQRVVVRDKPESAEQGIITVTFEPYQPASTMLALILDIDVFCPCEGTPPDTSRIWQKLEILHNLKNQIFFSSLAENAKQLFR